MRPCLLTRLLFPRSSLSCTAQRDVSRPAGDTIDPNLTLDKIGGLEEHVTYLKRSIIFPLRNKAEFRSWGITPPKGIMFHGPPGTGKTLLAKSLANEVKAALNGQHVSFFYHKGCESYHMGFGVTEENLRKLFRKAIKNKPSIIFFDEIDGLCPERQETFQSCHAYVSVVAALLGLIDSVKRGDVFFIAATNRLSGVDAAIRRPGRFDKDLAFPLPDHEARQKIIRVSTCKWCKNHPSDELLKSLADQTNGYTGSDLEKLCKKALGGAIARASGDVLATNVTEADWIKAIQNSNPSNSAVFGSTVFTPQPTLTVLRPLIGNIVNEIVQTMRKFIPSKGVKKTNVLRSFVVWEQEPGSKHSHNIIMNEALNDPELSNIPTFILNIENIYKRIDRNWHQFGIPEAIQMIVNQGVASANPCILYAPGIDEICNAFAGVRNFDDVFLEILKSLSGSNCLLLATCAGPVQNLPNDLKKLLRGYENTAAVRKPNAEEREQLFREVFDQLISNDDNRPTGPANKRSKTSETQSATTPRFTTLLMRAVELSAGSSIETICKLYSALDRGLERCKITSNVNGDGDSISNNGNAEIDFKQLHNTFTTILDDFHDNQL